jgi:hypothetical protein
MRLAVIIFFVLVYSSCANIGTLTGGQKDIVPPRVVKEKSTGNYQTKFKKQTIRLSFDEYIRLDDVFTQVLVSPPTNERPEITLNGKQLTIEFDKDEKLKDSATYTINFGSSVKDLNEGNPAKDLRFVFSTGDVLDSLSLSATVLDAVSAEPQEGILLFLYDNLSDTVVKKSKPFYFARTDKQGVAKIENIKAGRFKAFALKDIDNNFLFNQESERIGFPATFITLPDSSNASLQIRLYDPKKSLRLVSKDPDRYGSIKLQFNAVGQNAPLPSPDFPKISSSVKGLPLIIDETKDSTTVFYNPVPDTAFRLFIALDSFRSDTIRIKPKQSKADFLKKTKLSTPNIQNNGISGQHPDRALTWTFNYPIKEIDLSRIILQDTNKQSIPYSISKDSLTNRTITLTSKWKEDQHLSLKILPNAFTDHYGQKNDTIFHNLIVNNRKIFGDITLNIKHLNKNMSYICQLIRDGGIAEISFVVSNQDSTSKIFTGINPGAYTVKIIMDENRNGIWDQGDYDGKKQPEKIFTKKLEPLRANWTLEAEVEL